MQAGELDEEMSGKEPVTEAVMEEEEGVKKGPGLGFILGKLSFSFSLSLSSDLYPLSLNTAPQLWSVSQMETRNG